MKITTFNGKVRCDVKGCSNLATVCIVADEKSFISDSIKMCNCCAKGLSTALKKHFTKEQKVNE